MPLGQAMTAELKVGTRTSAQGATGEVTWSYSYTNVDGIPCRFHDSGAMVRQASFGQNQQVDAVAIIDANETVGPVILTTDTGERRQVQIDGVAWEVTKVADLGNIGRLKLVSLRKWK